MVSKQAKSCADFLIELGVSCQPQYTVITAPKLPIESALCVNPAAAGACLNAEGASE